MLPHAGVQNCATKLELSGAIQLLPLDDGQIHEYLDRVSCADIWRSLQTDAASLEMARSPLLLRVMTLAYREISPDDWHRLQAASERRALLFDAYLRHLFARPVGSEPYSKERTTAWLARLAAVLKEHRQEEFLIERMQPAWLASGAQRTLYRVGVGVAAAVIFAVIDAVTSELFDVVPPGSAGAVSATLPGATTSRDAVLLSLMALLVGLAVASKATIQPVETLGWTAANTRRGLRRWLPEGMALGFRYGTILGLVGAAGIFFVDSSGRTYRTGWEQAGTILGGCAGLLALGAMARLARPTALGVPWRRPVWTGRTTNAVLTGCLYGGVACLNALDGFGVGAGVAFGVAVASILGLSRGVDDLSAARFGQWSIVGCVAWLGVLTLTPVLRPSLPWLAWVQTWLIQGVGFGATLGLLAVLWTRFRRTSHQSLPAARHASVHPRPGWPRWGHWVLTSLTLASVLRVSVAVLAGAGLLDLVRGAATLEIYLENAVQLVLASGLTFAAIGAANGMVFGVFIGALLGVLQGFTGPDVERRTTPNQGIRQSARNVGVFFLTGMLIVGLPYGLLNLAAAWVLARTMPDFADFVRLGLGGAALIGVLGAFVPAAACIQHYTLRATLWCQGSIPWGYARFLDHATDRMLLQRIGGRYRFIHVLLRDHFAAMKRRPTDGAIGQGR